MQVATATPGIPGIVDIFDVDEDVNAQKSQSCGESIVSMDDCLFRRAQQRDFPSNMLGPLTIHILDVSSSKTEIFGGFRVSTPWDHQQLHCSCVNIRILQAETARAQKCKLFVCRAACLLESYI